MILLDTHALIWFAAERELLSAAALEAIEATPERAISLASVQEVAYLTARGRLKMDRSIGTWIANVLGVHEVRAWAPTLSTSLRAGSLDPRDFHGDPVDRLIYATAVEHDVRLVTADERLRQFDPERTVW